MKYIAEKMDFDLKCSKTSLKEEKSFNLKVAVSQDFWHFFYETNPQGALTNRLKWFAEIFIFTEIFSK